MERLVRYVSVVDRQLGSLCRGSSRERVNEYARLAGFVGIEGLPATYRDYSLAMGVSDGGLLQALRMQAETDRLIRYYKECLRSEPETLDVNLPVVATYITADQVSLDVRRERDEPAVVETADGEYMAPLSRTWEFLLMQAAVMYCEPRRSKYAWGLGTSAESTLLAVTSKGHRVDAIVDEFACQRGLVLAWPSDECHRIAYGDETVVFARIRPGGSVVVNAMGGSESRVRSLVESLGPMLGSKWTGPLEFRDGLLRRRA